MTKSDFLKIVNINEDLSKHSTYKIGGKAKFFTKISEAEEIIEILNHCEKNNISILIIGGGSNILFSDEGFDGLVIKISNDKYSFNGNTIEVGAGARLQDLVHKCASKGLSGIEYLAGIPGSVGGAIRGNAGAYGHEISNVVESVRIIRHINGKYVIEKFKNKKLEFSYRDSIIKKRDYIIIDAILKLKPADKKEIQKIVRDTIKERNSKQPYDYPSAGCIFKNIEKYSCEDLKKFAVHKKIPVARIIQELGLKGKSIGGAKVSEKHSNFIINKGNAKASDVIKLINLIKSIVKEKYDIELEEEIMIIK